MRDRRYGPILIVRIECGVATAAAAASARSRATGLHRSFGAIRATYDTGTERAGLTPPSPPHPSPGDARRRAAAGRIADGESSRCLVQLSLALSEYVNE